MFVGLSVFVCVWECPVIVVCVSTFVWLFPLGDCCVGNFYPPITSSHAKSHDHILASFPLKDPENCLYLYVPLCTSITVLSSVGALVLISLSITVCLSVCLSVIRSVCLIIVIPSLSLYCYLYVFIWVSLSLCLPVLPALQFCLFTYFSVPVFVCFPASGSLGPGCSYS